MIELIIKHILSYQVVIWECFCIEVFCLMIDCVIEWASIGEVLRNNLVSATEKQPLSVFLLYRIVCDYYLLSVLF